MFYDLEKLLEFSVPILIVLHHSRILRPVGIGRSFWLRLGQDWLFKKWAWYPWYPEYSSLFSPMYLHFSSYKLLGEYHKEAGAPFGWKQSVSFPSQEEGWKSSNFPLTHDAEKVWKIILSLPCCYGNLAFCS